MGRQQHKNKAKEKVPPKINASSSSYKKNTSYWSSFLKEKRHFYDGLPLLLIVLFTIADKVWIFDD